MKFTDIKKVKFAEFHNKHITMIKEDGSSIKFQLPRMHMEYGISGFVPNVGPTRWNIDFSLNGCDDFLGFVRRLETDVIEHVHNNSMVIFGKQLSLEELKGLFNSNIKDNNKFRVKFDDKNTTVFDSNNNVITPGETSSGDFRQMNGTAYVELGGVYFLNNMFGITWKTSQLKVYEVSTFLFKDV